MAKSKIAEPIDAQLSVEASTPSHQLAGARGEHEAASERRALRSLVLSISEQPMQALPVGTASAVAVALADERRRLERDLHDGVQNELVALIVTLALAQEVPETPPALVETLAGLEARAQAALDSVRNIVRGIFPPVLADFGLAQALRAQAARAPIHLSLEGTAPRSTEAAEAAVYFACSEAIQNAAKYAGRAAQITLRLRHEQESLAVHIADDGRGFDPAHTPRGAGLQNIRDRIEDLGGTFNLASRPGHGTALTISLPWLAAADRQR
ncbi:MAG: histidine kinase [Solirubrobacteraceae bacterium]